MRCSKVMHVVTENKNPFIWPKSFCDFVLIEFAIKQDKVYNGPRDILFNEN